MNALTGFYNSAVSVTSRATTQVTTSISSINKRTSIKPFDQNGYFTKAYLKEILDNKGVVTN